jgi:hypothetical protein
MNRSIRDTLLKLLLLKLRIHQPNFQVAPRANPVLVPPGNP